MDLTLNKVAAGVVGFAMVAGLALAFTATKAHAVTLTELVELFIALEVIPADKADEARSVLAGQDETTTPPAGTGTAGAVACTGTFARNLTVGDTGADVKELQQLLNARGFTVATAGAPGSAGMESTYFGPATKSAVTAMQNAYAGEILAPLGLTTGTGFFGASTRAKANALCSAGTPATPGDEDEDEDADEDEDTDLSGEASLITNEMSDADDDEINEGEEEAEIGEFTVEFSDGDAMITRLDIALVGTSLEESDPWDVFNTVYLMVDDEVVAEKDIDSKSDYLDDDDGTIRFSGLDIIAEEDEELVITIAVDVANSVDGADDDQNWTVSVNGLRFVDGTDVTSTETFTGEDATFSIGARGGEDEIIVKTSSSDLDSSIIKVEDDKKSDWVTVFVFDLDTDDSENDISIDSLPVSVTVGSSTYNALVNDARLVIDGTTVDSSAADVDDGTTATGVITFDVDGDVVIDAGDRVKAELQLRFNSLLPGDEGTTVLGAVTTANAEAIDAEGADDVNGEGSATGEAHQLLTQGIFAEIVSITETKTAGDNNTNDVGDYVFKIDLTAFEGDFYVGSTSASIVYHVEDGNGATVATTSSAALTASGVTKESTNYKIPDGETETFTLTVSLNPDTTGFYRVVVDSVTYGTAALTPTGETHTASPAEDFESDVLSLNA
jgi:hypothetical protein